MIWFLDIFFKIKITESRLIVVAPTGSNLQIGAPTKAASGMMTSNTDNIDNIFCLSLTSALMIEKLLY